MNWQNMFETLAWILVVPAAVVLSVLVTCWNVLTRSGRRVIIGFLVLFLLCVALAAGLA